MSRELLKGEVIMCGIVGYIGEEESAPILMEGLRKLEYRGYDSAGVAIYSNGGIAVKKFKGRLSVLEEHLNKNRISGSLGIGHTRWATHGEPNDINAHPHSSSAGNIAVVHNGIIENYMKLKEWLNTLGIAFATETDTEVIAHLVEYYYEGNIVEAVQKAVQRMEGAYAIGVICKQQPETLVAVRKDSPLVVGIGQGENFIASDIPALLKYTRDVYFLEDGEMAVLTKDHIDIFNELGMPMERNIFKVTWDLESAEKGGYEHFMLKEMYEQPKAVRDTMMPRLDQQNRIVMDELSFTPDQFKKFNKIVMIACGTAWHAGLIGKEAIERFARIPVEVEIASEFRYKDPFVDEKTLLIAISQSGETADTLAALREAKARGAHIMTVTNVVGSRISREAQDVLYTWAGPEIAVASTKAYITQVVVLYLLGLFMAELKGIMSQEEVAKIVKELKSMPDKIQYILDHQETIQEIANKQIHQHHAFYIGRGLDDYTAKEGSLKLKEISYVHSEAIAAGELKHGTIALLEEGTLIMAMATQERLYDKMLSNMKEVKARGAYVVAVTKESLKKEVEQSADIVLSIPDTSDILAPILSVVPLQLFAYYMSVARGADVDKPKNLAKSVTVE